MDGNGAPRRHGTAISSAPRRKHYYERGSSMEPGSVVQAVCNSGFER